MRSAKLGVVLASSLYDRELPPASGQSSGAPVGEFHEIVSALDVNATALSPIVFIVRRDEEISPVAGACAELLVVIRSAGVVVPGFLLVFPPPCEHRLGTARIHSLEVPSNSSNFALS
jgi:hypothetical protein